MDRQNGNSTDGTSIVMNVYNNGESQKWIVAGGKIQIYPKVNSLCISTYCSGACRFPEDELFSCRESFEFAPLDCSTDRPGGCPLAQDKNNCKWTTTSDVKAVPFKQPKLKPKNCFDYVIKNVDLMNI